MEKLIDKMRKNKVVVDKLKTISKVCPVKRIQLFNSEITIIVKTDDILNVLLFFKNNYLCQFKVLSCLSGVDHPKSPYRFTVVYDLLSIRYNNRFKVKVFTYELGEVPSSVNLYSAADWFECEIWDMFGVFFKDHPNLKRILTDYGFQGYPLRKDFPLTGFIEMRYNESNKRVMNEAIELSQEYRTFNFSSTWEY